MERTQEYWENRPEVYKMQYNDFAKEYEECMDIARKKEANGNLDPSNPNYIPMTDEEIALHKKDWKAFSRYRGFSEYDIAEYARWHKLSGQTDDLEYAINDPWRRTLPNWDIILYIKHIERAIRLNLEISKEIISTYEILKKEIAKPRFVRKNINESQIISLNTLSTSLETDSFVDEEEETNPKKM